MTIWRATSDMTRPEAVEADSPEAAHVEGHYESEENAWLALRKIRMDAYMACELSEDGRGTNNARRLLNKFGRNYRAWRLAWLALPSSPSQPLAGQLSSPSTDLGNEP